MGLSLWLVPTPSQASLLQQIMHTHPSPSSSTSYPHFHPHITLSTHPSSTSLQSLLDSIPTSHPPITATFKALKSGDIYFQSVFIAIDKSPEIMHLYFHILKSLSLDPVIAPEFPHLSLYYIADADSEERVRTAHDLIANRTVSESDGGIVFHCSNGQSLSGFDGVEIWATLCDGPVDTWRVLAKVALNQS